MATTPAQKRYWAIQANMKKKEEAKKTKTSKQKTSKTKTTKTTEVPKTTKTTTPKTTKKATSNNSGLTMVNDPELAKKLEAEILANEVSNIVNTDTTANTEIIENAEATTAPKATDNTVTSNTTSTSTNEVANNTSTTDTNTTNTETPQSSPLTDFFKNNVGPYIKSHVPETVGFGLTGAMNLGGLFDNDQVGGQLLGAALGTGAGLLGPSLTGGKPLGADIVTLAGMTGGALGSLADKLIADKKKKEEQQRYNNYNYGGY